jgi:hypothetical protein
MICRRVTSFVKPALLVLCAVVFAFSASRATSANPRNNAIPKLNAIVRNSNAVLNGREAKRNLLRMIIRKAKTDPKVATLLTACGCPVLPQDAEGLFGGCFRNCLASWGISYGSLLTCGGVCVVAATGNPIAIGVCAACLGTAEWIVGGCAMNCVWGRRIALEESWVKNQLPRSRSRGSRRAKLSFPQTPAG